MPVFDGRAVAAVFLLATAVPAAATGLPDCGEAQTLAPRVYQDEADDHRLFERTLVSYPSGTDLDVVDEFASMTVQVDASGRPTCLVYLDGHFIGPRVERKLRAAAQGWRYRPFERDGRAVPVVVAQWIDVQILPGRTAEVPQVRAEDTSVTLVRAGCFWQCEEYAVTVRGDGWVGYRSMRHVDVEGARAWKIPAADVAPLLELARDPGLWAADDRYVDTVHDAETIMIRVDAGGKRKQVKVYPAEHVGSPIALRRLADAIVKRTNVQRWVRLSNETIDELLEEGFDFSSLAGRDLLVRAIRHGRNFDEAAILRLMELGASAETSKSEEGQTPLDVVLQKRHSRLIAPLIERGVLLTDGRPDQEKIDQAFQSAIRGGRLAPAQLIWNIAGTRPHPALDFTDVGRGKEPSQRRSPVVLLLVDPIYRDEAWEGEQIARWLESLGNDLTAMSETGRTLMHAVDRSNDPGFMHFLLSRKLDPAVLGQRDLMAYSVKHGEDMALTLLDAQLERRPGGWELPSDYRHVAELQDWPRVIAWLEAHPVVTIREPRRPCPRVDQVAKPSDTRKPAALACGAGSGS